MAGCATDLRDVGRRVLRLLANPDTVPPAALPNTPVILVAEDLTPSDTASLNPTLILEFCTAYGGPTSHSAIIARSESCYDRRKWIPGVGAFRETPLQNS